MSKSLLFFFSSLGVFNALFLAAILGFQKRASLTDKLLAALLLVLCIRVAKSVVYYFEPSLSLLYLQFGMTACLFIGPLAYFFILSATDKLSQLKFDWRSQLLFWAAAITFIGVFFPFSQYPEYWRKSHLIIYHIWLVYLLFAGWELRERLVLSYLKQLNFKHQSVVVLYVFIGNLLIWLSYYSFKLTSYIVGALSFSFVVFLSILLVLHGKFSAAREVKSRYSDKEIDEAEVSELMDKVYAVMSSEDVFTDPNLKMPDLAKKVRVSPQKLSQFLNDNLGKSFKLFINEYRIEYAKKRLIEDQRITVELLSEQSGFNSTSTFHEAFKKVTGTTPVAYRKKALANN